MLNNLAAAEALLRLFNIDISWQELQDFAPAASQPLASVMHMINYIDRQRQGELVTSDPSPELLQMAYAAGYRLCFDESQCKGCGVNEILPRLIKPESVGENVGHTISGPMSFEGIWSELKKSLRDFKAPTQNLQTMGEIIISRLSTEREIKKNWALRFGMKQKKELQLCLFVKKQWKLSSISLQQMHKLGLLLNEAVQEVAGQGASLKLSLRDSREILGFLAFQTKQYGFNSHERRLIMDVNLTASALQHLNGIDFQAVMMAFQTKVAALPADQYALISSGVGNYPTKDKYYARFLWSDRQEVPEHLSKVQLEEMIEQARALKYKAK